MGHPIFFGREQESEKLLRYVTVYRGVLLYGVSGTGKSSLVNAGFIPKVMAEGFAPERIRVQPRPGEEIIVERIPKTLISIFKRAARERKSPGLIADTMAKEHLKTAHG